MRLRAADLVFDVRPATVEDVAQLLSFIRAMGEFEKLDVLATEEILRESLFGGRPSADALLAFVDGEPAAYAVYFFTFSTMMGKRGLWLDDLYVDPAFRKRGLGKALMAYLAELAVENDCARFEWMVLDWNTAAVEFYRALGASVFDDLKVCRLDGERITRVAKQLARADENESRGQDADGRRGHGRPADLVEANKELVRRYVEEVLNTGDVSNLASFIAPDYVEVYENTVHPIGIEGAREHVLGIRRVFPDLHVTIEHQVAEGEWVVTRITARGTHRGPWLGMAPTGKPLVFTGVNVERIVDGRIVEHGGAANLMEPLVAAGALHAVNGAEK